MRSHLQSAKHLKTKLRYKHASGGLRNPIFEEPLEHDSYEEYALDFLNTKEPWPKPRVRQGDTDGNDYLLTSRRTFGIESFCQQSRKRKNSPKII